MSRTFLIVFVVCSAVLVLVPQIDLGFSSLFYSTGHGSFLLRDDPLAVVLYRAVTWVSRLVPAVLIVGLAAALPTKRSLLGIGPKSFLYLLLVFVVAVLLVVNALFKNCWGRARPNEVEQFGGAMRFTPAFVIANERANNGSWPSGHASLGFYFFAVAHLVRKRRAATMALAGALGGLIGLARIAQGRHFLSDVISAFFIVYIISRLLYYLMYETRFGSAWRWGDTS